MTSAVADGIVHMGISGQARRRVMQSVTNLIPRLMDRQVFKGQQVQISEFEIRNICHLLPDILVCEPVCLDLDLETPIHVVGDILGQYVHLLRIFEEFGHPPAKRYLFLGNYTWRNMFAIETLTLLFCYKLLYPESIYLLRGRCECSATGRLYGFYDQCVQRFSRRSWHDLSNVFCYLPIAATVNKNILCVHSGLSPMFLTFELSSVAQMQALFFRLVTRPSEMQTYSITTHLIWSEPDDDSTEWDQNPIGLGYLFGRSVVKEVCDRLNLKRIIRSSGLVQNGYAKFADTPLVNIFSAPDFEETYENKGAVLQLSLDAEQEVRYRVRLICPLIHMRRKHTTRMNVRFEDLIGENVPKESKLMFA
ncbi:Serine/threonine-protein phosphatase [Fasciolopsis buskii]|uniref:protein-serine/threonine phosphatase n=1 Tax=Fasciolopsis buskii TaxID=27845 RepID=A0A8E0RYT3_9TREM|nr:Serine/threonine-protein phosphatase [Fasciolopsis buski]